MNPNRIGAVLLAVGLLSTLSAVALADHPPTSDGGFDLAWSEPMNQESFWESYFGDGYTCTKFANHSGSIPSSYEAAVVKSGSDFVRVYTDPPANVLGPPNPNVQHPNRRHTAPFSWVMKCDYNQTTTSSTSATTTTIGETTTSADTTTTTEATTTSSTTTPTTQPTTTTTSTSTTSTSITPTTSTPGSSSTQPAPTTTSPGPTLTDPGTPETLPFTGPEDDVKLLAAIAGLLGLSGVALLAWKGRSE